jgi:hypothetical protein
MPIHEPKMSLCCLHPTEIKHLNKATGKPANPATDAYDNIKAEIICTHCGRACDFVPNFNLDQTNLELLLRRYKDGDYDFMEAFDGVQEIAKHGLVELLDRIGKIKYPDKDS